MLFLLDTNAFSDLMRGVAKFQSRLATIPVSDRVITCPIVLGEILYGIARLPSGKRRQELEISFSATSARVPAEPVPPDAGNSYAEIKHQCRLAGASLDENDIWIAATAMTLGAVLVT